MPLHESTFDYLQPTDKQKELMSAARSAVKYYAEQLGHLLPEGPDKAYTLCKLREVAMWANITITRDPDGAPRAD